MRDECPCCGKRHNLLPRECIREVRVSHAVHGALGGESIKTCEFCGPMYRYVSRNFPGTVKYED